MKINNKILGAIIGVSSLLITSCDDDGGKVIDEVFAETTRGAVLRTIESGGVFDRFDTSTSFGFTLALKTIQQVTVIPQLMKS